MEEICFVVDGYPTEDDPIVAFIKPIVHAIADNGYKCVVLAPQSVTNAIAQKKKIRKSRWVDITKRGNSITILQPKTITGSNKTKKFNNFYCRVVCKKILKKNSISPDVIYAHFWNNGVLASQLFEAPIVVATGESKIWVRERYTDKEINNSLKKIKGVISVSTENIKKSEKEGLMSEKPEVIVLPNAIDADTFFNYDKMEARKKLDIDKDVFIVSFVGAFIERKGINRLLEAISRHKDIKAILVGKGDLANNSDQILFKGSLPHNEIVDYLNASDVFVLPTTAEGCCNAIIEAMACGLPIISSDQPFNDDILDDTCSIRVDSLNIHEIEDAICELKDNVNKREKLGRMSLDKAKKLTINERAERIIWFLSKIQNERTNL